MDVVQYLLLLFLYTQFVVCILLFLPLLNFVQCFQLGCALSQNTASILILRFLGGAFAAAPLANSGYVL